MKKIYKLIFVLIINFFILEIVLRLVADKAEILQFNWFTSFNPDTHHDYISNTSFTRFPATNETFPKVKNVINDLAMRGPRPEPKKSERYLIVGDSFIQADEVPWDKTFWQVLNVLNPKVDFIAHGMGSWAPTSEWAWINHTGLSFNPDHVVLFLFINDLAPLSLESFSDEHYRQNAVYDESGVPQKFKLDEKIMESLYPKTLKGKAKLFLKHFYSFQVPFSIVNKFRISQQRKADLGKEPEFVTYSKVFEKKVEAWPPEYLKSVNSCLETIVELSKFLALRKIDLKVTLIPYGYEWADEMKIGKSLQGQKDNARITQGGLKNYVYSSLQERKIEYIDLFEDFNDFKKENPTQLLFNEADGHWNSLAHELVAKILNKRLFN